MVPSLQNELKELEDLLRSLEDYQWALEISKLRVVLKYFISQQSSTLILLYGALWLHSLSNEDCTFYTREVRKSEYKKYVHI